MKTKNRNVTPEMAIRVYKRHGMEINHKQAEGILDFLYKMAEIAVQQVCKEEDDINKNTSGNENSDSIHQGKHRRTSRQRVFSAASGRNTEKIQPA
ncbi:hypothetical protein MM239_17855 [Belliella sp. DSM 111904]|uniref:Uncharacterized protein n=1 Tax=Belliella filtrata TaxID=2923435 RepID=A0ABS9V5M2_9BACT|nr:hypothetical protein [Belliella filtrata]MCH7411265.1 hypothetical protein [Belliella filtrata]